MLKSLVLYRNLTFTYRTLRAKERQKAHRFELSNLDAPLLNDDLEAQMPNPAAPTSDLPPNWLELHNDCTFILKNINGRISDLTRAQKQSILNIFGHNSSQDYAEISRMSNEISDMIKRCDKNLAIIRDVSLVGNGTEAQLRKNAANKIANELLNISSTFRKMQKSFYDGISAKSMATPLNPSVTSSVGSTSNGPPLPGTATSSNNAAFENVNLLGIKTGNEPKVANNYDFQLQLQVQIQQQQQQQQHQQQSQQISENENLVDRTRRLQEIATTMQELKDMYTQMATMVVEQGSMLDQIDYNVRVFSLKAKTFASELRKSHKRENSKGALRVVRNLVLVIFAELVFVVLKFA